MAKPKRVLHIFGGMNRGGAETALMNAYRVIDRAQVQFDFAVHISRPGHYDEEIRGLGGRILPLQPPAEAGWRNYGCEFTRILEERGPFAAVHSHVHWFSGFVLRLASQHRIPVRVSHSHNTRDGNGDSLSRRAYRMFMRALIRRHATHLIGCSREASEALFNRACWSDRRVSVLPHALHLADYACAAGSDLREELELAHGTPLVGHIANLSPAKNHSFLIEIFDSIRSLVPGAHLVLAGDGPLRAEIEAAIRARGLADRVHLLGVRNDVPRILAALDLMVFPSLWEGLPVVLVEAQAAGLRCLLADSVTRDVDLRLGLTEFLSLSRGAEDWARAAVASLGMPRPAWTAREWALKTAGYDARTVAASLTSLYLN